MMLYILETRAALARFLAILKLRSKRDRVLAARAYLCGIKTGAHMLRNEAGVFYAERLAAAAETLLKELEEAHS